MPQQISSAIRNFIQDNLLFREDLDGFPDTMSFLGAGIIDSTGVLELVCFLETEFGIEVADEDMLPENLDSVCAVSAYVERKLGRHAAAA